MGALKDRLAVPTLKEELERKAIEAMTNVMESVELGDMTEREGLHALEAIWTTVCGLTDTAISELVSIARSELAAKVKSHMIVTVFGRDGKLAVFKRDQPELMAWFQSPETNKSWSFQDPDYPKKSMKMLETMVVKNMLDKGWKII